MTDQDKLEAVVDVGDKFIALYKGTTRVKKVTFDGGEDLAVVFDKNDTPQLWDNEDDQNPISNPKVPSSLRAGWRLEVGAVKYPITVKGQVPHSPIRGFHPEEYFTDAEAFTSPNFDFGMKRDILERAWARIEHERERIRLEPGSPKKVIVLEGIRRCGKTYIMSQIVRALIHDTINYQSICYFQVHDMAQKDLLDNFLEFLKFAVDTRGVQYILLDEIQKVERWGSIVRYLNDKYKHVQIIICGSKTKLESNPEITGRCSSIQIFPFSFCEFESYLASKRIILPSQLNLELYLVWGGFPHVVTDLVILLQRETFSGNDILELQTTVKQYMKGLFESLLNEAVDSITNNVERAQMRAHLLEVVCKVYEKPDHTISALDKDYLSNVCLIYQVADIHYKHNGVCYFAPDVAFLRFVSESFMQREVKPGILLPVYIHILSRYPALAATLYNKCVFCVNSTALIFVQETDDITKAITSLGEVISKLLRENKPIPMIVAAFSQSRADAQEIPPLALLLSSANLESFNRKENFKLHLWSDDSKGGIIAEIVTTLKSTEWVGSM
jgi:hypothetical protein